MAFQGCMDTLRQNVTININTMSKLSSSIENFKVCYNLRCPKKHFSVAFINRRYY